MPSVLRIHLNLAACWLAAAAIADGAAAATQAMAGAQLQAALPQAESGRTLPCTGKHRHGLRYSVQQLQLAGGNESYPTAINNRGWVVGYSWVGPGVQPTLWIAGQPSNIVGLGGLGGSFSYAYDINDAGKIVGGSSDGRGFLHAYSWYRGVVKALPSLDGNPASTTLALGVNQAGVVGGEGALPAEGTVRAALWNQGQARALALLPGGHYASVNAINDAGYSVGTSNDGKAVAHAVLWKPGGEIVDLGPNAVAYDINNAGRVVGYTFSGLSNKPAKWTRGLRSVLPTLGGETGVVFGINESDQAVGLSQTPSGAEPATIWFGAKPVQLDTLLDEASRGLVIDAAYAINDKGQIAAVSRLPNNGAQPLLLTPHWCRGH